ncbi:MAG: aminopeptidase [Actinomycetota bacterium]|nr:aminopeptidase [Actinomycetota bacterium]
MPGKNLTRDEARERADLLSVSAYEVALDLTTGPTTFRTRSTVDFTARQDGEGTFIDLIAASVEKVTLNGESLDPATHFDGFRVQLPAVRSGANTLTIDATGLYMNTGEGLHRFVDPVDNEVYLYTQFEVAHSRRMFAVFEQPDLKATYAFTVTAPAHWQVVSTEPTPDPVAVAKTSGEIPAETPEGDSEGGSEVSSATWTFAPTPTMSSYITALIAGPYHVVRDQVETRKGPVPLAILCRRSLTLHLDAENIFDCTKRGFSFFENEFDCAYPFTKYDQIFTPEYNWGAMENAGAVTFNEKYLFRAKVTEAIVERRALTILHELAHMWFGNLVTMAWWDNLWLNESFAEWASTTCSVEATQWETAWTTFSTAEKSWAYQQDQLSSTHPIVADIRDLQDVEVNFDGITYAKGASVLKQLVAYVGREPFMQGLREYFSAHAWSNTTLSDLLDHLVRASGRDLHSWSKLWLETAGVNTLRPEITVDDQGVITAAAINQTAIEAFPTLRPHTLVIGSYSMEGDSLVRVNRTELDVDGERTEVPELVGQRQPDLLLVNDDDLAYAKIRLDERSMATVLAHPRGFTDSLPRALVLGAAWDMTRDAEMSARDFCELVLNALPGESDSTLRRMLLNQLQSAARLYVAPEHRVQTLASLTTRMRELAMSASPGSDAQLQLVSAFAGYAHSDQDARWVRGLLEGTDVLDGLAVDTEMRWTLLTSLAAAGAATESEIGVERQRDNTSTGHERAALALASIPTAEAKAKAWRKGVEEEGAANQTVDAIAEGFVTVHDTALLAPYIEKYHSMLTTLWATRTHAIAESVVQGFYPRSLAGSELLKASQAWLDANPDANASLRRRMSENRDGVKRSLAAQQID